jgi:hypothetical protein
VNSLNLAKDQLAESFRKLSSVWEVTAALWHDSARQDFEAFVWTEFEATATVSIAKLQNLIEAIDQIEREIP